MLGGKKFTFMKLRHLIITIHEHYITLFIKLRKQHLELIRIRAIRYTSGRSPDRTTLDPPLREKHCSVCFSINANRLVKPS